MNIWSHLIGAIFFLYVALYIAIVYPNMNAEGRIMYDEFQTYSNSTTLSEYVDIKIIDLQQSKNDTHNLMVNIENLSYLAVKSKKTN